MYLIVYVVNIVITRNDVAVIYQLKEVSNIFGQRSNPIKGRSCNLVKKYALDILKETDMIDCKPVNCPMDPNKKLIAN